MAIGEKHCTLLLSFTPSGPTSLKSSRDFGPTTTYADRKDDGQQEENNMTTDWTMVLPTQLASEEELSATLNAATRRHLE